MSTFDSKNDYALYEPVMGRVSSDSSAGARGMAAIKSWNAERGALHCPRTLAIGL